MKDYSQEIDSYMKRLFPIMRSITGEGNRETLKILQEIAPIKIGEYSSGQKVFDWTIPDEWNMKDAWIKDSVGNKIVDFKKSNIHVVSYSLPINKKMKLDELKEHLHYLEELPEAIPYRTSYYKKEWVFCLSLNDYKKYFNDDETYEVFIDSELKAGSLIYGELLIEGKSKKEILISTYICHPSLANDNLSGPVMTALLAKEMMNRDLNYSYRFVFVPETIGAVAYCANNEKAMKEIDTGLVVTCVGGQGQYGYKQSYDKGAYINQLTEDVFNENDEGFKVYPFSVHGSDERQYSSQGFRINCVSICKDKYYDYEYYHTSLDDLNFVKPEYINASLNLYLQLIDKVEAQVYYKNVTPNCEVMLSKHDLYPKSGGGQNPQKSDMNELDVVLWLLFYCDEKTSLQDVACRLGLSMEWLIEIAQKLETKGILKRIT